MTNTAKQLLVISGLIAAIWGMSYGIWYAVFDEHQTLEAMGLNLAGGFIQAASGDLDVAHQALAAFSNWSGEYNREVHAHAHWISLGMLMIILGLAIDTLKYPAKTRNLLALALVTGTFIFPAGVLLQTASVGIIAKVLSISGTVLLLGGMTAYIMGIGNNNNK